MGDIQPPTTAESSVSQSVVEAVAEAEGVDPITLSPPLYEIVDPDALDQIFAPTSPDSRAVSRVIFSYNGYEVTVDGDRYVSVESRERAADDGATS